MMTKIVFLFMVISFMALFVMVCSGQGFASDFLLAVFLTGRIKLSFPFLAILSFSVLFIKQKQRFFSKVQKKIACKQCKVEITRSSFLHNFLSLIV